MFFEREQYTTPVCEMQGCMAFLRRKRQKTGRSELLPVAFVQFLLSAVLQRGQVEPKIFKLNDVFQEKEP